MNDADLQELIDKAAAGRLSREETQRWNALVAARPELEEDVAIGEAVQSLPKPPAVSSNFTALVMQEIRRSKTPSTNQSPFSWLRWPKLARLSATAAIVFGIVVTVRHQRDAQRTEVAAQTIAGGVKLFAATAERRSDSVVTVFQDFEAIRRLPASPVDENLLAALSE